jgi:hypothetical protein
MDSKRTQRATAGSTMRKPSSSDVDVFYRPAPVSYLKIKEQTKSTTYTAGINIAYQKVRD